MLVAGSIQLISQPDSTAIILIPFRPDCGADGDRCDPWGVLAFSSRNLSVGIYVVEAESSGAMKDLSCAIDFTNDAINDCHFATEGDVVMLLLDNWHF